MRCKLDGAASLLLEKTKGKNNILQQQDYRGRTPAEIARKKGSKRVAEMVDEAIVSIQTCHPYTLMPLIHYIHRPKLLGRQTMSTEV